MTAKAIIEFVSKHRDILVMVLCASLIGLASAMVAYRYTSNHYDAIISSMNEEKAKLELKQAELEAAANKVTVQVVTEYVDRVRVVKEKGDVIVKEVPVYVTNQADHQCKLTEGFAAIHDAAAKNTEPVTPPDVDAELPVALSDVTTTIVKNYNTCHEVREQLTALQDWVRKQQANVEEMNK